MQDELHQRNSSLPFACEKSNRMSNLHRNVCYREVEHGLLDSTILIRGVLLDEVSICIWSTFGGCDEKNSLSCFF